MKIVWVVAVTHRPVGTPDIEAMKVIGPVWGGVATWRHWKTDNVIASSLNACRWALERKLQTKCNFMAPKRFYQDLQRPGDVQFYGEMADVEAKDLDDLVALNLAGSLADIVLCLGFNLQTPITTGDSAEDRLIRNRYGVLLSMMRNLDTVQWVLVDHDAKPDPAFGNLANVTCDSMQNVLKLLDQ